MTLVRANDLEVIRIVVSAGEAIPTHEVPCEITVQCLEGRVLFTAQDKSQELSPGQFLCLAPQVPHALKGIVDSCVLVTIMLPKKEPDQRLGAIHDTT